MHTDKITLAYGSGTSLMHNLIKDTILPKLNNPILSALSDAAYIDYKQKIAFTTDSFVVSPLFFEGSDIGKLAVCGTVNDLLMMGARPEYLSLALIIEEGLPKKTLDKIINSVSSSAKESGVYIATGDFKVVEKGACDKIFINTSGIGRLILRDKLDKNNIKVGDKIIITGNIAEHGLAVLAGRSNLSSGFSVKSDCQPLSRLLLPLFRTKYRIRFMRDPTRGGLATTLNEITSGSDLGVIINEKDIPLSAKCKAACELLGVDPLYLANEGKALIVVPADEASRVVSLLRKNRLGLKAAVIGEISAKYRGKVVLKTILGTERIITMSGAEQLPRIC